MKDRLKEYWKWFVSHWYVTVLTIASLLVAVEVLGTWACFAVPFAGFMYWGFKKVRQ